MKYNEKIEHAKRVAEELTNHQSLDQIKKDLKEKGLYDKDIENVMASARSVMGEKLKPLIRKQLLSGEPFSNSSELGAIDPGTLEQLVQQEKKAMAQGEKKKVNGLLKQGASAEQILQEVHQEFYPRDLVDEQISAYSAVTRQNSGKGRLRNIGIGLGLIALGIGISFATMSDDGGGRLFYGVVVVGLIMVVKGFMTAKTPE